MARAASPHIRKKHCSLFGSFGLRVTLKRIDYLDDHDARLWHFDQNRSGREFEIPIHLRAITDMFNKSGDPST